MDEPAQKNIRTFLHRSREDLKAAGLLFQTGHYRAALSRAYYAAFYAASALLLSQGIVRSKHSGVQAALGEFFIRAGHLEAEYGEIYAALREAREAGDYDIYFSPASELAERALDRSARFVERVERYLEEHGFWKPDG